MQGTPRAEALIAVLLDDKDAVAHAVLAHMRMWGGESARRVGLDGRQVSRAVQRFAQQRPPWLRPEDYALRVEGQRLAAEAPQ